MVARIKGVVPPPQQVRIILTRGGAILDNRTAAAGRPACKLACIMLALVGELQQGDTLRVIAWDN